MIGWEVIPRVGFGRFTVSPHGLGIAFGYFIGAMLLARRARKRGYNEDDTWNAAALAVIGAIVGARVAYIIGHYNEFSSPVEWLRIWEGGISLLGGLIGAFLVVLIYVRVKHLSFFELVDLGAPGLAIGIALGRIGDLVIGDHLGRETSGWWGWVYKGGELISPPYRINNFGLCVDATGQKAYSSLDGCLAPGMAVHQTALYDSLWSLVILGILLWLDKKPRNRGFLFLWWVAFYGAGRIATDFARVDKTWFGTGLTGSQITSIIAVVIALILLVRYQGVPRRRSELATPGGAAIDTVTPEGAATVAADQTGTHALSEHGLDNSPATPADAGTVDDDVGDEPPPATAEDADPYTDIPHPERD